MAEEIKVMYGSIPGVVRALFHDKEKGDAAAEKLLAMGLPERDLEVIPITPREETRRSRPLLEILGLRKSEKAAVAVPAKFQAGEIVLLVRLQNWSREQTEATLKDLGADEVTYFPPAGEETSEVAYVAPARAAE